MAVRQPFSGIPTGLTEPSRQRGGGGAYIDKQGRVFSPNVHQLEKQ